MQYALLVYETQEAFDARRNDYANEPMLASWRAYHAALLEAGVYVGGDPLLAPETGTTVRIRHGVRDIQDGPYANTKEQLAGFTILELDTLDEAIEWASRCPAAAIGAIEVRPLAPDVKARIVR